MNYLYVDCTYSNRWSLTRSNKGELLSIDLLAGDQRFTSKIAPETYQNWDAKDVTKTEAATWPNVESLTPGLLDFIEKLEGIYTPVALGTYSIQGYLIDLTGRLGLHKAWTRKIRQSWVELNSTASPFGGHLSCRGAGMCRKMHQEQRTRKTQQEAFAFMGDEYDRRLHYLGADYCNFTEKEVRILPKATQNPEAMKYILQEIQELFFVN